MSECERNCLVSVPSLFIEKEVQNREEKWEERVQDVARGEGEEKPRKRKKNQIKQ